MLQNCLLIINSDAPERKKTADILAGRFRILEAESGTEALQLLKEQGSAAIAILSLALPAASWTGFLEAAAGDPLLSDMYVIVSAEYNMYDKVSRAVELGAEDFIIADVSSDTFASLLRIRVENAVNRLAAARLQQENARLQAEKEVMYNSIPGGVFKCRFDPDLTLMFANDGLFRFLGYSRDELRMLFDDQMIRLMHPADAAGIFGRIEEQLSAGSTRINLEIRLICSDKSLRWISLHGEMMGDGPENRYVHGTFVDITAQKLAEIRLRNSQDTLREAINVSGIQYFTYFPEQKRIEIYALNDSYSLLPMQWNDYPDSFLTYVRPPREHEDAYRAMVAEIDAGAPEASCTIQMQYKGVYLWIRVQMQAIQDTAGRTVKAQGYSVDVTTQKRAEERYRKELENLRSADMSGNSDLISKGHHNLTRNKVLEYTSYSEHALCAVEGMSYEQACRMFLEIPDSEENRRHLAMISDRRFLMQRFFEGETRFTFRFSRAIENKTPGWILFTVTTFESPESGDVECFTYTYDVTAQALEDLIIAKQADFGYENLGVVYRETGASTAYLLSRGKMESRCLSTRRYDDTLTDIIKLRISDGVKDEVWQALNLDSVVENLDRTDPYLYSFKIENDEGAAAHKQFLFSYMDERRSTIFYCMSDITKQYELEHRQIAELKAAKQDAERANEAKSDFLSRMSHDIRTPLNGIIGMARLAEEQDNPPRTNDCLSKIDTSSKFLLGLINDILDMSKAESGRIELHPELYLDEDFRNYIDSVIRPLCSVKNQTLIEDLNPVLTVIPYLDILRFNQIIFNLLSNAVKYTPEGGTIKLCEKEELRGDHKLRITTSVSDTGIGMSEEFQRILFEPFAQENRCDTAENRGSGLGLAIVKKMVDLMNGTIEIESSPGNGSTFTVTMDFDYIEADQTQWKKAEVPAAHDQSLLKGRRVLLCEDHPLNQEIAVSLLESRGMSVSVADNGQSGAEKFAHSPAGFYDVILMDIRMPVMDGYAAARTIRAMQRPDAAAVPILAMTADAFADDVRRCLDAGMDGHLAKPVDPDRMYEAITDIIMKRKLSAGSGNESGRSAGASVNETRQRL